MTTHPTPAPRPRTQGGAITAGTALAGLAVATILVLLWLAAPLLLTAAALL